MRALHNIVENVRTAPEEVTLQSGIVLKVKHVSDTTLRAVVTSVPLPEVPIEPMGADKIPEPWPDKPEYQAELLEAMAERNRRLAHACGVLGTECLTVPDGYFRPEEDGWVDGLRIVGVELEAKKLESQMDRYDLWLQHHAMSEFLDLNKITQTVLMRSAIMEVEVLDAINFFRRDYIGEEPDGSATAQDDGPDGSGIRTPDGGVRDRDGAAGHGSRPGDTMGPVDPDGAGRSGGRSGPQASRPDGQPAPKRSRRKGAKGKDSSG